MKNKIIGTFVALGDGYIVVKHKGKLVKHKIKNEKWD